MPQPPLHLAQNLPPHAAHQRAHVRLAVRRVAAFLRSGLAWRRRQACDDAVWEVLAAKELLGGDVLRVACLQDGGMVGVQVEQRADVAGQVLMRAGVREAVRMTDPHINEYYLCNELYVMSTICVMSCM